MKDKPNTIPAGKQVLGRVLNANGEPIDGKGPITGAQRIPLYRAVSTTADHARTSPVQMFETGIKVIDLLAPIPRGGIASMVSGIGQGKMVVTEEMMHTIITRHNGYVVLVAMGENTYAATDLRDMTRDLEAEAKVVLVFEQMTDSQKVRRQLLRTGVTIAAHFRDRGHEALLIIGKDVVAKDNAEALRELRQGVQSKAIITLLFEALDEFSLASRSSMLSNLDGQIVFSRVLAKQNVWPAIDRLFSSSRLLGDGAIDAEHVQIARQVKQILQRNSELRDVAESKELAQEDQEVVKRAQKIHLFFTQPFFVAEAYTDVPGEYVLVEETVRSFTDLLEGRYDEVPVEAFRFVGAIEQALARGKTFENPI